MCLLASQYSLIEHANALNDVFPVARERNVNFVIGSSLNAGFISGSPRYNYGKTSWNPPPVHREAREVARRGGAVRRRSANRCASVLCGAGRRRGIDRRRAYRGADPRQCQLHAGDDPAGVLGRVEAAKPYRSGRAHACAGVTPAAELGSHSRTAAASWRSPNAITLVTAGYSPGKDLSSAQSRSRCHMTILDGSADVGGLLQRPADGILPSVGSVVLLGWCCMATLLANRLNSAGCHHSSNRRRNAAEAGEREPNGR